MPLAARLLLPLALLATPSGVPAQDTIQSHGSSAFTVTDSSPPGNSAPPTDIQLTARSAKAIQADDVYTLCVQLENRSSTIQQTLYGRLGWGENHGLRFEVLGREGRRVRNNRLDHYRVIPSTFDKAEYYVALQPGHFIGICRSESAADIFPAPGQYTVRVSYRSPVTRQLSHKQLAMYYEDGRINAEAIEVSVIE